MIDYSEIIHRVFGSETELAGIRPVAGGDINAAYLLTISDGSQAFLKVNTKKNAGFFQSELEGLQAIRDTGTIRVPRIYETGIQEDSSWLLMEFLEAAPAKKDYWEQFGIRLAEMHRADPARYTPGGKYGFPRDNYIGAGLQVNTIQTRWVDFFRDCRLDVQFRRAYAYFSHSDRITMQSLLDHLDQYLTEPEYPSLLHGDLWGGNFVTGPDGYACLIDPAVYAGNAEADLAMTELFGGFAPGFYDGYRETNGILPEYSDRRDLYNLYHLLNHLNLFGEGYYNEVMRIARRFR